MSTQNSPGTINRTASKRSPQITQVPARCPNQRARLGVRHRARLRRPGGEERDSRELYSLSTLSVTRRAHDQAVLRSESGGRSFYTPNARPRTRPNPMTRQSRGRSCCACAHTGSLATLDSAGRRPRQAGPTWQWDASVKSRRPVDPVGSWAARNRKECGPAAEK
jgi:hypothetical protein